MPVARPQNTQAKPRKGLQIHVNTTVLPRVVPIAARWDRTARSDLGMLAAVRRRVEVAHHILEVGLTLGSSRKRVTPGDALIGVPSNSGMI